MMIRLRRTKGRHVAAASLTIGCIAFGATALPARAHLDKVGSSKSSVSRLCPTAVCRSFRSRNTREISGSAVVNFIARSRLVTRT